MGQDGKEKISNTAVNWDAHSASSVAARYLRRLGIQ